MNHRYSIRAGLLAALLAGTAAPTLADDGVDRSAVITNYADIALAKYSDSLETARDLDAKIDALIEKPSDETLQAAREAWLAARVPYQQTEAYRFGNPVVDDWEGRVNAWPLDEGLIDYVDASYGTESDANTAYTANIIANPNLSLNGETIDAGTITPALLQDTLQEAGGVEANVATGYHAIEFLLWGQDLNGTDAGAGSRPATDFAAGDECTGGNCERRAEYLKAASDLLIADLEEMVGNWETDGAARKNLTDGEPGEALRAILTGLGSLSYGELAGERMKLGLLLHDPEEEHDCFSDNTHNSHLYDAKGIQNVYLGTYGGGGSEAVSGPSLSDLVKAKDPALDEEMQTRLEETMTAMQAIADKAEGGEAYDQQIGEGNEEGNARVQAAIDALIAQTRTIERVIAALDLGSIELEGSDSLDNPNAVFQ
ncbi:imelysin family protein [Notoacmeibacter sp. MSK16QG-6]|uniref:imelysin family protein n=1 Tax=Notoacmeibacter sp. MSK16QG-6 TaxID=2957982 RepID=UPI0020A01A13|nr:imelysin family protein [Notoacmeibacter sp. MSK16QG-6]MCP1198564.1 peptidase [Notoacmeibacter sp. MSK16QG-6]